MLSVIQIYKTLLSSKIFQGLRGYFPGACLGLVMKTSLSLERAELEPHTSPENLSLHTWSVSFLCVTLLHFNIMFMRFIHIVICVYKSFLSYCSSPLLPEYITIY